MLPPSSPVLKPCAGPAYVDEVDKNTGHLWRFHRTTIERADQLTNGKAWIQTFEHVLQKLPRPRRTLGISLSECTDPRHTMPSFGSMERNAAVKAMRDPQATPGLPEGARQGIGTQLKLPSGEIVLVVCNVGPQAPLQLPQKFRDTPLEELAIIAVAAKCPHMGGCLNEGELKDVEDIAMPGTAKVHRAIVRCPWHNMQFDLWTGEGVGNYNSLPRYPCQVMHGALYIGVHLDVSQTVTVPSTDGDAINVDTTMGTMEVDMEDGPMPTIVPPALTTAEMPSSMTAGLEAAMRVRSRSPKLLRHITIL